MKYNCCILVEQQKCAGKLIIVKENYHTKDGNKITFISQVKVKNHKIIHVNRAGISM